MRKPTKLNRISEAEYLSAEERSRVRHEFVDGYVFSMTGATQAHGLICLNIATLLHSRLVDKPCRVMMNELKVQVESARSYYYPDVVVDCGPFNASSTVATKPVFIVEVLSPSTAGTDRREKLIAYQKIESLKEYLIVYQDRQQAELYRKDQDGQWVRTIAYGDDEVVLESLEPPAILPLSAIYKGYNPPTRVKEEEAEYSF